MDLEAEVLNLKRRVGDLEGAVSVLIGKVGKVPAELATLQSEGARRFDQLDAVMLRVVERLDTVNTQVWSLRDDMPSLIREVLGGDDRAGR